MAKVRLKVSRRIRFQKNARRELSELVKTLGTTSVVKDFYVEVGLTTTDEGQFSLHFNVVREWKRGETKHARKLLDDIAIVVNRFVCPKGMVLHQQFLSM